MSQSKIFSSGAKSSFLTRWGTWIHNLSKSKQFLVYFFSTLIFTSLGMAGIYLSGYILLAFLPLISMFFIGLLKQHGQSIQTQTSFAEKTPASSKEAGIQTDLLIKPFLQEQVNKEIQVDLKKSLKSAAIQKDETFPLKEKEYIEQPIQLSSCISEIKPKIFCPTPTKVPRLACNNLVEPKVIFSIEKSSEKSPRSIRVFPDSFKEAPSAFKPYSVLNNSYLERKKIPFLGLQAEQKSRLICPAVIPQIGISQKLLRLAKHPKITQDFCQTVVIPKKTNPSTIHSVVTSTQSLFKRAEMNDYNDDILDENPDQSNEDLQNQVLATVQRYRETLKYRK